MADWMDEAWNDFQNRMCEGDETTRELRLLKEAWLHGARTAIAKAQGAVSEFMAATENV